MKYLLFLISMNSCCIVMFGQGLGKPPIDERLFDKPWVRPGKNVGISANGQFAYYDIIGKDRKLVVKSVDSSWENEFYWGGQEAWFCADSKRLLYKSSDTVYFVTLGAGVKQFVTKVASCKVPLKKHGYWLALHFADSAGLLRLQNLVTDQIRDYKDVRDYQFDEHGNVLLLVIRNRDGGESLRLVDLEADNSILVWTSSEGTVVGQAFDRNGRQLAFIVDERGEHSVWYYRKGLLSAEVRATNRSKGIDSTFQISNYSTRFSYDGRWMFFVLRERESLVRKVVTGNSLVDVWSYKDEILQPEQLQIISEGGGVANREGYYSVVPSKGGQVVRLQYESEVLTVNPVATNSGFIVVKKNYRLEPWSTEQPTFWLVSLADGTRRKLDIGKSNNGFSNNFSFSPSGKYLVYWDFRYVAYMSYEFRTGITRNITKNILEKIGSEYQYDELVDVSAVGSVVGWFSKDSALIVYGNYDLWKIDPLGHRSPENITNGYGMRNSVKLRLAAEENPLRVFSETENLLLTGFDWNTKYNGFFYKQLNRSGDPAVLDTGPWLSYYTFSQIGGGIYYMPWSLGMIPVKAANAECWIISRQSAVEQNNYFVTRDFKRVSRLTNLNPQTDYNWLTAELVNWQLPNGRSSYGVLYKPENFDSTKKYPIIFNFYEKLSHRIYSFPNPEYTSNNLNIPWFVSNGYLVFTPDIHYQVGAKSGIPVGMHALNSVESAARHLSKRPYIDSLRMGIQGHSFGGMEAAFIATHSHLFAAAAEMAGSTNPVSRYLTLIPSIDPFYEELSPQRGVEFGHESYGGNPWEYPELYSQNSSVLNAHQTTIPLLITHNMKDEQVQWRQGVELFMALRRLGKRVWLLQYDNGGHVARRREDAKDHTKRLTQFFDYYLKGARPPIWMTRGVPARNKGVETGYELDLTDREP
ncbi:prolyl oligopeptidase family serine peptidase [Paraflavitalea sp. CAU 1676]|uniref:S9 family peptidase n=1 Tax=Paraflavitalea sp. CAU 1676 TaxID=3032598 RepID=UPI0023D98B46|nr:prolyl oligopeptidase family serine peptidase [Paraflavitalea sp. CAU 1676]MDF2192605.1 prolyl oligopeptidase family serine peptidase [Paraflavitalea sp. CAU 1676]